MKVLVYIIAFILLVLIFTVCSVNGIVLGAIPTMTLWIAIFGGAKLICKNIKTKDK